MKHLKLTIVLLGIVASFVFFNKDMGETTIHKMIRSDFSIEIRQCGCMGCGSQIANVYTENDKRWLSLRYNITSDDPGFAIVEFTREKENRLDSLIVDAIKNQEKGGCTSSSEYRIESSSFKFKFTDNRCSVDDFFNLIALHHSRDTD